MITVDLRSRIPIYEQLIMNIKELALKGMLKPDEQLPSVRQLAGELGINPNTIQKAYSELERQKVIYSQTGRGNFITPDLHGLKEGQGIAILEELKNLFLKAKIVNIQKSSIERLLEEAYSGMEGGMSIDSSK